ncbi:MAG: hypothetical protein ACOYMG_26485, partial [Candidatus Methylumidiphilus sp.]
MSVENMGLAEHFRSEQRCAIEGLAQGAHQIWNETAKWRQAALNASSADDCWDEGCRRLNIWGRQFEWTCFQNLYAKSWLALGLMKIFGTDGDWMKYDLCQKHFQDMIEFISIEEAVSLA